ncbi:arylesterase [Methylophaga sp. OBS3]|uniref:arylesterase n=1 Tax=Methylophaga sp. OBS3 TaxID=2991934 RepID=UPI00224CF2B8|nr:arylesterase [Methylophaga sp. OBS3]MCX4189251.1 arylesterase [Methylophaga sp. OBS3]
MKNKLKTIAYGLFLIAFVAGCEASHPIPSLPSNATILAFGDSLTYGTGADKTQSYPALLADALSMTVVNSGVPGEISEEGKNRLPEVLTEVQPQLVILCHGGNDLIRKLNQAQTKNNLIDMIETIQASGAQVILVSVPEPSILLSPPAFYEELAETYQLNLVKNIVSDVLSSPKLKSDPIHPNADGYQMMAQAILEKLAESGAVNVTKLSQ